MKSLIEKLDPARFTEMSGRLAAILGYLLDQDWSDPVIPPGTMYCTSDGYLGDAACLIGDTASYVDNMRRLWEVAELTPTERVAFMEAERKINGFQHIWERRRER